MLNTKFNWTSLRPLDGSQQSAFEELCCQLAAYEIPTGSLFVRKGTPDAGVECFCVYPDGTERGWQAKFFDSMGQSQWAQLDKSVETALEKHTRLVKYTICLPFDRPDPRIKDQKSLLEKWNDHVTKWQKWASEKGMKVEFDYWGNHEILERLSREEHRGRFLFWFGKERFSEQWFKARMGEAIKAAGPRYTPEIHVDLPIAQLFDALGRTNNFISQVKTFYRDIHEVFSQIRLNKWGDEVVSVYDSLKVETQKLLEFILNAPFTPPQIIPWDEIGGQAGKVIEIGENIVDLVEKSALKSQEGKPRATEKQSTSSIEQEVRSAQYYIHKFTSEVSNVESFSEGLEAKASNQAQVLVTGEAGIGKTHLFCDATVRRIDSGLPTILIMGQQLTTPEDPWTQIKRLLQLTTGTTLDEFLGALEAAAQAKQSKAIIFIDAVNEGTGRIIWKPYLASFLEAVSRYPWVSIAVSVRSSYERVIITDDVKNLLVRVEHMGFAEHEYRAARTFFDFFGIEQSSVPLLVPEFQNPLFLKILCQGLRDSGQTKLPRGLQGITAIFELFINSVNSKLSDSSYLDFNPRRHVVWTAINRIAAIMAEKKQAYLPIEEVEEIVNQVLPREGYEKSLYRSLVSEGVLSEDLLWTKDQSIDVVRFAYEKFSDHLIVKHLLDSHLDSKSPEKAFAAEGPLHSLVEKGSWLRAGLIEALCIQIPERTGKEFPEVVPEIADDYRVQEGFFESIIWRSTSAFSEKSKDYLNKYSSSNQMSSDEGINALLTVTTLPDHPYNADFLHKNLLKRKLPDRDAGWSIFLHRHTGGEGAVDRLVDWAWSPEVRDNLDDEAVRLCGTTLSWFLTTPNRFLRDKATKALVNLLTNRLPILRKIIQSFLDVDDLYVLERLYAVAYGCVMRSTDLKEIEYTAKAVYEWVFEKGQPPVHILIREYAYGVIEYAQAQGIDLDIDQEKVQPPYGSTWPDIPSKEEVDKFEHSGGSYDGPDNTWWGQNRIIHSVMSDDFAHYVIGTNAGGSHWLSLPLSEPQWKSKEEIIDDFAATLTPQQRIAWDSYIAVHDKYEVEAFQIVVNLPDEVLERLIEKVKVKIDKAEEARKQKQIEVLKKQVEILQNEFIAMLDEEKLRQFETQIRPQLDNPHQSSSPPRFDLSLTQRWIVKRVFDLGWTTKRFGKFDRYYIGFHGREAHKAERMGKKYQWIAYHEIMARIADNFQFRSYFSDDSPNNRYIGAWQLNVRDIDPSCVIRETGRGDGWKVHTPCWWFPNSNNSWDNPSDDVEWMIKGDDLPDPKDLIQITKPKDSSRWLALNGYYHWQQPTPPEVKHLEMVTREFWYIMRSYIVHKKDLDDLFAWAKQQSFMGRWMPEPPESYDIFLGEYYWSPAYKNERNAQVDKYDWRGGEEGNRIPKPVLVSTEGYVHESGGFDCSIEENISIDVPTKMIVDGMKLCWNGVEGCYFDKEGKLITFDPSVRQAGPSVLLMQRDAFLSYLEKNDYSVLWTILGEKGLIGGRIGEGVWKGRLEINGAFTLDHGSIVGDLKTVFIKPDEE